MWEKSHCGTVGHKEKGTGVCSQPEITPRGSVPAWTHGCVSVLGPRGHTQDSVQHPQLLHQIWLAFKRSETLSWPQKCVPVGVGSTEFGRNANQRGGKKTKPRNPNLTKKTKEKPNLSAKPKVKPSQILDPRVYVLKILQIYSI